MVHSFKVIIPVRLESTRLPRKALLTIGDKTLLQHVYESAKGSSATSVLIATDSPEIREVAESFGAEVCMTANTHQSGTERLFEVMDKLNEDDDMIIVNLQGDEFNMPPLFIDRVAATLDKNKDIGMATLCEPIVHVEDLANPHFVKVIFDKEYNAQDFRREPVSWPATAPALPVGVYGYGHIGIYAYRTWFIRKYSSLLPTKREKNERLEQLRVLENGFRIHVEVVPDNPSIGVDAPEDMELARTCYDKLMQDRENQSGE